MYSYFEDSEYVYLVLELCHNGELQKYLKKMEKGMSEEEGKIDLPFSGFTTDIQAVRGKCQGIIDLLLRKQQIYCSLEIWSGIPSFSLAMGNHGLYNTLMIIVDYLLFWQY